MFPIVLVALIKIALVIGGLMTAAAYLVLGERWIAAWIQDRLGPNRVGIPLTKIRLFGLGQPLADGVKFLFKAEYTPAHVDKGLYFFAPMTIFVTAIAVFAVIPFGSFLPGALSGQLGRPRTDQPGDRAGHRRGHDLRLRHGQHRRLWRGAGRLGQQQQIQLPRRTAEQRQLIAYELPMGLGILGVVLASGSLRLDAIMEQQAQTGAWNAFVQPLGMVVFCVASFAEAGRLPFDLPECEQELIGGYHTEYFGIKLMMYLVGEYLHMVAAAFLIVMLFFGGWHFWGLTGSAQRGHLGRGHPADRGAQRQGARHGLFLHGGPLELGPLPLRSIDVAGMAGDAADGHGQLGLRGGLGRVRRSWAGRAGFRPKLR